MIHRYGGFHKRGYPKMDGLQWKILLKWMIQGYPPLQETSIWLTNKYTHGGCQRCLIGLASATSPPSAYSTYGKPPCVTVNHHTVNHLYMGHGFHSKLLNNQRLFIRVYILVVFKRPSNTGVIDGDNQTKYTGVCGKMPCPHKTNRLETHRK